MARYWLGISKTLGPIVEAIVIVNDSTSRNAMLTMMRKLGDIMPERFIVLLDDNGVDCTMYGGKITERG